MKARFHVELSTQITIRNSEKEGFTFLSCTQNVTQKLPGSA